MENPPQPPTVLDVDEESFAREVVERSSELPVAVDFWAPWCGPCRYLGPVLEGLVEGEFKGQIVLAKLNTDENPQLSSRFGIRGIPAVKIFRNGQVAAEFVGALPEEDVRRAFRSVLPSEADRLVEEALALEASDLGTAQSRYREALEEDPRHPGALLGLGRIAEGRGDAETALSLYARVPAACNEEREASRRSAALRLREEALGIGMEDELMQRLEANPKDVEALYGLGLALAARGEHREALERLIEVVRLDRKFRDDAGRRAMVAVFEAIGTRSPLADEYRAKLASALY